MLKKTIAMLLAVTAVTANVSGAQVHAGTKPSFEDIYVTEDKYEDELQSTVVSYIEQYKETGYITGRKGMQLYYQKFTLEDARGTIVISHGLGENLERYQEMIYYYLNMGYSVYGMEHRGHSRSGRLGIDDTMVSIDSFDNYYKDLKTFMDQVVVPEAGNENLYLFAHSMGGGIGARFLQEYPGYFKAAVLSAPMLEIQSGNIPSFFAKLIAHGASITPWKNKYVIGKKPWDDTYDFENANTNSEVRYRMGWRVMVENPELRMGGVSYQWLSESYNAALVASSIVKASKVEIPVLLFQAGKDTLVGDDGQNKFARYAKNCKKVRYAAAKHTLYLAEDEVLHDYYKKIFAFLEEY